MPYAVTPEDVEARWRPLDAAERNVAVVLLQDAAVLLDARLPRLRAQVTAGTVLERQVVIVLADMVQRVLRNPDVQTSLQLSADGSVGQSFPTNAANAARPRLEVTDYDVASLQPAPMVGGVPARGVYSLPYGTL
jgi:hypothetical protein